MVFLFKDRRLPQWSAPGHAARGVVRPRATAQEPETGPASWEPPKVLWNDERYRVTSKRDGNTVRQHRQHPRAARPAAARRAVEQLLEPGRSTECVKHCSPLWHDGLDRTLEGLPARKPTRPEQSDVSATPGSHHPTRLPSPPGSTGVINTAQVTIFNQTVKQAA